MILAASLVAGIFALAAPAIEVKGPDGNISLGSIEGSDTLVTVVLKSGAEDPNLKLVTARSELVSFTGPNGNAVIYPKGDIAQIRVQGSVVPKRAPLLEGSLALRPEDQRIVDEAISRARELFQGSKDNQELRIKAAALLSFKGDAAATEYLNSLATSNNLQTQMEAARGLYLAGQPAPENLIKDGLDSNNRNLRAAAAELAGLFKYEAGTPVLMEMLNDRSAQYAAPAAVALARLGNREIIPTLFDMLGSNSEEKNNAGMAGLTILGGEDVIETARHRIEKTDGLERYRHIRVLFALGDDEGRKQLIRVFNEELAIRPEAALLLAVDDYWEAIQYLQERLKRREDPTQTNLLYRARNARSIMEGGNPSTVYVFQELLQQDNAEIKKEVLRHIGELADRTLLKLIQTTISHVDNELSIAACNAAMSIANAPYRQRLQDLRVSL